MEASDGVLFAKDVETTQRGAFGSIPVTNPTVTGVRFIFCISLVFQNGVPHGSAEDVWTSIHLVLIYYYNQRLELFISIVYNKVTQKSVVEHFLFTSFHLTFVHCSLDSVRTSGFNSCIFCWNWRRSPWLPNSIVTRFGGNAYRNISPHFFPFLSFPFLSF